MWVLVLTLFSSAVGTLSVVVVASMLTRFRCIPFRFSIQNERRNPGSDVEQERGKRATNRVSTDYPREYFFKNGVYVPNTQY
jgi:hypothetical protein